MERTLAALIAASDHAAARCQAYQDLRERVGDQHEDNDQEDQHDQ